MLQHNLTIAWRNIQKYLSQNIISVLGLSASLVCFSLCMHFGRYIMGMDKHFKNYDRIAEVVCQYSNGSYSMLSPLEGKQITATSMNTLEHLCMIINVAQIDYHYENESGMKVPVDLKAVETDSTFAEIFGVKVVAGSWEQAVNLPNSIVLSETKACQLFGSASESVGRTLAAPRYKTIYTVRAVMKDYPRNISFFEKGLEALKLNDEISPRNLTYGYNWHAYIYGLIPDGVSLDDVNRELKNSVTPNITHIIGRERTDENIVATRMGEYQAENIDMLVAIIVSFATLILLVGLLNFFHFLVGSILNRTHEYSLRRLMGCRTGNLFGMLFTQSFLMLVAAMLLCFYAIYAVIPRIEMPFLFIDLLQVDTALMTKETCEYLGWILLLCALICLIVCLYIRRISILQGVIGLTNNAPRIHRHIGRNLMMGLQFFICWVFVSLTVGFYLQGRLSTDNVLNNFSRMEKEEILSIPLNSKKTFMNLDEKRALINRLKAHAGVKDVLTADGEILTSISGSGLLTEKGNRDSEIEVLVDCFSENYFQFMNIELVRGVLPQARGQIAVDVDFAALFEEDVLGRVFYHPNNYNTPLTVTAVVERVSRAAIDRGLISRNENGWAYMSETEWAADPYIGHLYLKCYSGQMESVRQYVMEELRKVFAESVKPEVKTLMKDIEDDQGLEVALQDIIFFFAIVSLVITLLGVYSAITLDTEHRRREVALRKVHGARFGDILWLFGRRYFYLLVLPAMLAFPLVWWIFHRMREGYKVFIDCGLLFWLSIFLGVTLLVVLTILWRILKVARLRPAEEMKRK